MDKRGDINEATPDVEERLRDKRATDDPTSKVKELDNDVNKRLSEKAAEALKPSK